MPKGLLSCFALLSLPFSPALAQGLGSFRTATDSRAASSTSTAVGASARAEISQWMRRLPASPDATLTSVTTFTPLQASVSGVTVTNTTAATISGGRLTFTYGYRSSGNSGTGWGASDGSSGGFAIDVPPVAPGATVALAPWSLARQFNTAHGPFTGPGFWSDVLNDCVGVGNVDFSVNAEVSFTGVFPTVLTVSSLQLDTSVAGTLTLFTELHPTAAAVSYCPGSPHFGGPAAELRAYGVLEPGSEDLALEAFGVPMGTFCALFVSAVPGPMPFGTGSVCFGNPVFLRSEVRIPDMTGVEIFDLDLGPAMGGTTLYAQCVFRDIGGFNTTNALELPIP